MEHFQGCATVRVPGVLPKQALGAGDERGRGRVGVQAYWSGNKQDEAMFLHSPLLMELKAVEVLLGHEQVRWRTLYCLLYCLPSKQCEVEDRSLRFGDLSFPLLSRNIWDTGVFPAE